MKTPIKIKIESTSQSLYETKITDCATGRQLEGVVAIEILMDSRTETRLAKITLINFDFVGEFESIIEAE